MNYRDSCDIILPTCGELELVRDCVESLMRSTSYPYRLIVVYNGNQKEALIYLQGLTGLGKIEISIIEPGENLGWIMSINKALEMSKDSKYVCFQNDDTIFTKGWLEELVDIFEKDPNIGIANPEWEKPNRVSIDEYAAFIKKYKGQTIDTDWCRGHSFFVRREVIEKIGGLDTVYLPGYYDDRDYSLKAIKAGYKCVRARAAFVYHIRNATMNKMVGEEATRNLNEKNSEIFYKRWGRPLKIVFVIKNSPAAKGMLQKVCLDQNKVVAIVKRPSGIGYEHTNMKILSFKPFLFNLKTFVYIAAIRSKKSQKAVDLIFTDDEKFYKLAEFFSSILPSRVTYRESMNELSGEVILSVRDKKERDKSQR